MAWQRLGLPPRIYAPKRAIRESVHHLGGRSDPKQGDADLLDGLGIARFEHRLRFGRGRTCVRAPQPNAHERVR
eukprot:4766934-Pleurochrysis_carterae.AAC.3